VSDALLLDTHILLWAMSSPDRLSVRAARAIEQAPRLCISTITAWEIVMLCRKGRIALNMDPARWLQEAVASLELDPLAPSLEIAIDSDLLPDYPRADPADRFIIATARRHELALVTADEVIRGWSGVETIW